MSFSGSPNDEKFGRVFIEDKDDKLKPSAVPTACFSNLDLRWYNLCGDIHHQHQEYLKKSFLIGFNLSNRNSKNDLELFEGKLRIPIQLGYSDVRQLGCFAEVHKMAIAMSKGLGLVSSKESDPRAQFLEETRIAALFILTTPGRELFLEGNNFLLHLLPFVFFNELLRSDKSNIASLEGEIAYSILSVISQATSSILKGNSQYGVDLADLASIAFSSGLPLSSLFEMQNLFRSYVKLNKSVYKETLKFGNEMEAAPFLRALAEYTDGLIFQMSKDCSSFMGRSIQTEMGSTLLIVEAIALQSGIRLDDNIRTGILFKTYQKEIAAYTKKVYDIFSYNNEVDRCNRANHDDGITARNEVYYLHQICHIPLGEALQTVLEDANEGVVRLEEISSLMIEIYGKDESISSYIQIVKEVICGYVQWLGFTTYYHPNLVFDCYVREDDN